MQENLKIYFASDQHFGAPTAEKSFPREQKFVAWLDEIKKDANDHRIFFHQPEITSPFKENQFPRA